MGLLWVWARVIFISMCFPFVFFAIENHPSQSFIVRVEETLKPLGFNDVETWYSSILHNVGNSEKEVLHVYKTVFHGFSAKLTESEAEELRTQPEVVGVFPDRLRQLHITRTPMFLGLGGSSRSWVDEVSNGGSDIIIGVLDTGIWPEHPSFNDDGLNAVPSRWKGECQEGEQFSKTLCNKKIIGARYFTDGYEAVVGGVDTNDIKSCRDTIGHGTHTASTAAGSYVAEVSFLGFANGSARGMAPKARVAAYKVCWEGGGCTDSDILAGLDTAVEDGVDIISLSLGPDSASPYHTDPIAIGAYAAMKRGIFVSSSAGNAGRRRSSVTNTAPWMMTVGASSIDRDFPADLVLEDGQVFTGSSLYNGSWPEDKYVPLIYAGDAAISSRRAADAKVCKATALDPKHVRGSIVVCHVGRISEDVKESAVEKLGGLGMVLANVASQGESLMAKPYQIPALEITYSNSTRLVELLYNKTEPVKARLGFRGTQVGVKPSPVLSYFSSRGPDNVSDYIMKPDVTAPGLNILAAWPDSGEGLAQPEYSIESGTSMSCPHVSGIGALLKGAHPEWTPAMIKSALMTTAYDRHIGDELLLDDFNYQPINPWGLGSGHVDPSKAVDPGLVYDISEEDYFKFLCASSIGESAIETITERKQVDCNNVALEPWNLNYPAIMVVLDRPKSQSPTPTVEVMRTVTHVGDSPTTYTMAMTPPEGCIVVVEPPQLVFNGKYEKYSYVVKVSAKNAGQEPEVFGKLTWTDKDKKHDVISPIIVKWPKH